jgi:NAD(P)-dependent dehydrogenase (short-subunit alcohol dehydrogenase family)
MPSLLAGRVAIVTGSGRGIGRGIAQKLAEEGASVVVNGTTQDAIDETVESIRSAGGTASGCRADVRNATEVESMVESAVSEYGKLEILVNNAGVNRDAMFERMTEEQWDEVIDTHLKGTWLCCKYAAPKMREAGYGRVVNIGSEGATFGNMGMINYVTAKAGLLGFTMTLARELGRWARKDESSLTCNLIMPGYNETRMTAGVPDNVREMFLDAIALGRIADPKEDVGSVVAFLASPAASYVTGAKFSAGGGINMNLAT